MKNSNGTNVRIDTGVHNRIICHLKGTQGKVGKFTEIALLEKIEREEMVFTQNAVNKVVEVLAWAKNSNLFLKEIPEEQFTKIANDFVQRCASS